MLVLGLTGAIASGKSTVASLLQECGATCIDADKLGHESYRSGTACFEEIVQTFGTSVVGTDGEIDRKALGAIVFSSPEKKAVLEAIVWPHIRTCIQDKIRNAELEHVKVVVLEAAVLFEAKWDDMVQETWVVTAPTETAIERLMHRNNLTLEDASRRMTSQLATAQMRIERAHVVVNNCGTKDELREQVIRLWEETVIHRTHKNTNPNAHGFVQPLVGLAILLGVCLVLLGISRSKG